MKCAWRPSRILRTAATIIYSPEAVDYLAALTKNEQVQVLDQEILDEVRREHPDWDKEFVAEYIKERIKAARRVFNDPDEIERIIELLEAASSRS